MIFFFSLAAEQQVTIIWFKTDYFIRLFIFNNFSNSNVRIFLFFHFIKFVLWHCHMCVRHMIINTFVKQHLPTTPFLTSTFLFCFVACWDWSGLWLSFGIWWAPQWIYNRWPWLPISQNLSIAKSSAGRGSTPQTPPFPSGHCQNQSCGLRPRSGDCSCCGFRIAMAVSCPGDSGSQPLPPPLTYVLSDASWRYSLSLRGGGLMFNLGPSTQLSRILHVWTAA